MQCNYGAKRKAFLSLFPFLPPVKINKMKPLSKNNNRALFSLTYFIYLALMTVELISEHCSQGP